MDAFRHRPVRHHEIDSVQANFPHGSAADRVEGAMEFAEQRPQYGVGLDQAAFVAKAGRPVAAAQIGS